MKKLIALLLALVLVMGLAACGNTTAPETTPATTEERIIISDLPSVSPCIQEAKFTVVNP